MVYKIIKMISLFLLLFLVNTSQTEGFIIGTLINTQKSLMPIESLRIGDTVCDQYSVTHTQHNLSDCYVKVITQNCIINAAPNQKFYVDNKQSWINAKNLEQYDLLSCQNNNKIEVHNVKIIYEPCLMYCLSIKTSHVYSITPYKILAHNIEPTGGIATVAVLSVACPPAAAAFTACEVIAFGIISIGGYYLHKKYQKRKHAQQNSIEIKNATCSNGNGKDPNDKDNKEKHAHGVYKDASYHHINSKNNKSACPINGQKCLNNSLPIKGYNEQRIGIEKNNFVIFKQTRPGEYHGYTTTWKEINARGNAYAEAIKKTLIGNGLVTPTGRIINSTI